MDLLALVTDRETFDKITPNFALLEEIECRGIIPTTKAAEGEEADFVSRFFGPRCGVPEDPVTGSAHCFLAPFWSAGESIDSLFVIVVSHE